MHSEDEGEPGGTPSGDAEGLAPVIPLFGGAPQRPTDWNSTWADEPASSEQSSERTVAQQTEQRRAARQQPEAPSGSEFAEKTLLKKLRGRSLSIAEARDVLVAAQLDDAEIDEILTRFEERGYLDDAALAEQVVHVGLDRKGQGRRVIAQSLAKRRIPRDVADAALLALPDDDRERALEFARSKARSFASVERDAALRRLAGQLARRGYGGSLAHDVARQALEETARGSSGVRFE
ncbi:regulatory protein RecX [Microbacterium sp. SS28]|uniref:regulatory protein RecX n=1 Tax=Microbacterium sp. SS28 TaxID=2919948 RepID=UPI001FAA64CF|nr:regulatory protein RecX [Microbacterium sp. SS28]